MPKRTKDWTKAQRMLLVRRAIEKSGEADVRYIREFLCSNYGFKNNETLRRRIYEDLNGLNEMNEIQFHYLNDTGNEIEDIRRTYTLFGFKQSIIGVNSLKAIGGDFLNPSNRKALWRITNNIALEPIEKHLKIIFHAGQDFYLLSLPKDALPSTLVIGRTFDHEKFVFPSAEFIKTHGARAHYLGLPSGNLSVRSDGLSVGHAVLKFDSEGVLTVTDLNTANLTEVSQAPSNTLVSEIYAVAFNAQFPLSYRFAYRSILESKHDFDKIKEKPVICTSPTLMRIGEQNLFIIGDFVKPDKDVIFETVLSWKKKLARKSRQIESVE